MRQRLRARFATGDGDGGCAKAQGFTLLEVLVAFVIAAGLIAVLLRVFGNGLKSADLSDHYSRATTIAESKLTEAATEAAEKGVDASEGSESGEIEDTDFKFVVTTTEIADPTPPTDPLQAQQVRVRLVEITVRVMWDDTAPGAQNDANAGNAAQGRSVSLSTLRLLPKKLST